MGNEVIEGTHVDDAVEARHCERLVVLVPAGDHNKLMTPYLTT